MIVQALIPLLASDALFPAFPQLPQKRKSPASTATRLRWTALASYMRSLEAGRRMRSTQRDRLPRASTTPIYVVNLSVSVPDHLLARAPPTRTSNGVIRCWPGQCTTVGSWVQRGILWRRDSTLTKILQVSLDHVPVGMLNGLPRVPQKIAVHALHERRRVIL